MEMLEKRKTMKAILNLRAKMAQYQEIYYLIFILIIGGVSSAGLMSQNKLYRILMAVAAVCWLLKMAVTDYTVGEILIMAVIAVLLGLNYMNNGENLLIRHGLAIFGAKNVNLNKVFKYGFYTKAIITLGVFTGIFLGLIENVSFSLPKNGKILEIYSYGYGHPNSTFFICFSIVTIAIMAFKEKVKWYVYVIVSLLIAMTYKYIMCRTGIVAWAALCLMLILYKFTKNKKTGNLYRMILVAVPILLCIFTFVLDIACRYNEVLYAKVDLYFTGRIEIMNKYIDNLGLNMLGVVPGQAFDNMYFYIPYNYGWIIFAIVMFAYTFTMWYCYREKLDYELIVLAAMSVYGFMEYQPLSVPKNFSIICLSYALFRKRSTYTATDNISCTH
jgi:hypothetical protein